ncbi:hypothetical protein DL96DRAFT_1823519 [Flagelloscypha sp. PMI_526]|nr:hypothetical protein DL96DRAFT_1823519 [Flagelloscypha sp. PMI_526]
MAILFTTVILSLLLFIVGCSVAAPTIARIPLRKRDISFTNGDFEVVGSSWTLKEDVQWIQSLTLPHTGQACINFYFTPASLTQAIAGLTPNATYSLAFFAAPYAEGSSNGGSCTLTANVGGAAVASFSRSAPAGTTDLDWQQVGGSFTASGETETLSFVTSCAGGYFGNIFLDDVTLSES